MGWCIGKSVYRKDTHEKVTGAAKYTAHYSTTTMHKIKLVVSSHTHAKLTKIDTSNAWKIPGVRAILLGQSLPLTGDDIKDRPILAFERVRYHGEPIAAVVADHPHQAKKAAELIEVIYEPLPVVHSPKEALLPDAKLVHEGLATYEKIEYVYPEPDSNIADRVNVRKGDGYRGFSHSELLFVFERAMDILARKLVIPPLEFRKENAILPGHTSPTQTPFNASSVVNLPACLEKLAELMNWKEGSLVHVEDDKVRVKGISCSRKTSSIDSGTSSGVVLLFNLDGSINILSGIVEIGMGTKTILAQLLAEKLKMDIRKIHIQMEVNTQTMPEHYKTAASRGTLMAGRAIVKAADDAIQQLKNIAAQVLICSPDDLEVGDEKIYVGEEPDTFVNVKYVCYDYKYPNGFAIGGQIISKGNYTSRHLTHLDRETGVGKTGPGYTVGAQGVEVEFDQRNFTYRILKAYSVIDAGKVLNSKAALGQVMGEMSIGQNHGSSEVQNPRLRTYASYRYGDHPDYIVHFIETPHIDGPFGARGVSESGVIGMPAALANSLSLAAGVILHQLSLTPESIWREKKVGIADDLV